MNVALNAPHSDLIVAVVRASCNIVLTCAA